MAERFALRHIEKSFGSVHALRGVDFLMRRGEVHALLGENGAGKTTLMRIAYGLTTPDSGHVELAGKAMPIGSPRQARALGIGMVHQHFTSVPELTVWENIALTAGWPVRPERIRVRVRELCDRLELPLDPDITVSTLPVALKQRLEIVKALASEANILLLDEPTAVLTPDETQGLLAFLRRFAKLGGAVALITHKLNEALDGADRVTVLRAGTTTLDAPVAGQTVTSLAGFMVGGPLPTDADDHESSPPSPGMRNVTMVGAALPAAAGQGTGLLDGTLTIRAGELVGIASVAGNGQRELFRLLAGLQSPTSGTVDVVGPTAFVPEDRSTEALIPEMTVTENVVLGVGATAPWVGSARPHVINWRRARDASRDLLLEHDVQAGEAGPEAPVGTLSGGNQQKLILGRALFGNPNVLLAENPTRGLDVKAAADLHRRLRLAAQGGAAVLFHSGDLDEVLAVAGRIIVVSNGVTREVVGPADRLRVGRMMLAGDPTDSTEMES